MDIDKQKFLFNKFYFLKPKDGDMTSLKQFGIECGDGWFGILINLCSKLALLRMRNFRVVQIKEKFGTLRFYFDSAPQWKLDKIIEFINEASEASSHICEVCGAPGRLVKTTWLLLTRCNSCIREKR